MTKEKIILPRGEWILVIPDDKKSLQTEEGLSLPATEEQDQKAMGKIKAFGADVGSDIKEGKKVIYGAFAGENIITMVAGKEVEYKLLLDEDIIAFIN